MKLSTKLALVSLILIIAGFVALALYRSPQVQGPKVKKEPEPKVSRKIAYALDVGYIAVITVDGSEYVVVRGNNCVAICPKIVK